MRTRIRAGRWARRWALVLGALVVAWLAVCVAVFAFPRSDAPGGTEVTYVLSSDGGHAALDHSPDLWNGELVVSRPASVADWPVFAVCEEAGVTCIAPDPETTQGEAEAFARLAEQRGWGSVTVVSQTSHLPRIRILMDRCFPGTVQVVAVPEPWWMWPYRFVYESGAMVKVALTPGCDDRLPWDR